MFIPEHVFNANEIDAFITPNESPFFWNKVPLNLNGCEIIVSTGIFPPYVVDWKNNDRGIELDFIFASMQHMNASANVIVDPRGWHGLAHNDNEEHTGRLALLKKESFDMMTGAIPAHITIYRDFDTSDPYLPNMITFIVPTAAVFPSSLIVWSLLEVSQ